MNIETARTLSRVNIRPARQPPCCLGTRLLSGSKVRAGVLRWNPAERWRHELVEEVYLVRPMKSLKVKMLSVAVPALFEGGESIYQIATRFGITTASVEAIIRADMKRDGRKP